MYAEACLGGIAQSRILVLQTGGVGHGPTSINRVVSWRRALPHELGLKRHRIDPLLIILDY